jgi:hypothetical protein
MKEKKCFACSNTEPMAALVNKRKPYLISLVRDWQAANDKDNRTFGTFKKVNRFFCEKFCRWAEIKVILARHEGSLQKHSYCG